MNETENQARLRRAKEALAAARDREWRNAEIERPGHTRVETILAFQILAEHSRRLERERNAALDALEKIESHYVDGDDTYEAWRSMGDIAANFLSENAEHTDRTPPRIDRNDITEIRKAVGWTQQRLADYLGVTRETVIRREDGTGEISRETELAMRYILIGETGQYHFPWRD
jgi:DNA-binding XRE family transcriptional regulator